MKHGGLLNKYFCKKKFKYPKWLGRNCQFPLFPLWFYIFMKIDSFCRPNNQSNSPIWTKVIWNIEDYSINICVKKNPNIPNETEKIVNFLFSHCKSKRTKSCHSNHSSYLIGTKNTTFSFPLPIDAICETWKESASRLQRRCRLKMLTDGRQTDDGYLHIL